MDPSNHNYFAQVLLSIAFLLFNVFLNVKINTYGKLLVEQSSFLPLYADILC